MYVRRRLESTRLLDKRGRGKRTVTAAATPVAANIVDARSEWGSAGAGTPRPWAFLSVFENDSGPETTAVLKEPDEMIKRHMPKAGRSIVSTTRPLEGVPRSSGSVS